MPQTIKDRYKEHSGLERKEHGYHKPKSKKESFERFEEKIEQKKKHKKKK